MNIGAAVGNGGWVRWETVDPAMAGLVRFEERDGRLEIGELYLEHVPSSRDLARVPLARLSAWANDRETGEAIRRRLEIPGPLLSVAASYYATTFGGAAKPTWERDMLWSQVEGSGVAAAGWSKVDPKRSLLGEPADPRLEVPTSRPYPPEFYAQVAEVYSSLATHYRNPVARIADANGEPLSKAQRWVRVARDRGLLPPAQHGRRG